MVEQHQVAQRTVIARRQFKRRRQLAQGLIILTHEHHRITEVIACRSMRRPEKHRTLQIGDGRREVTVRQQQAHAVRCLGRVRPVQQRLIARLGRLELPEVAPAICT